MKTKISEAVIGGLVGTDAMTMVMFVAPLMGIPKMSPPSMLSMMMGVPSLIVAGNHQIVVYLIHFNYICG